MGNGEVAMGRTIRFGIASIVPLLALAALAWCETKQETAAVQAPPPAVTVSKVIRSEITPSSTFTGRIEAVDKVDLRARVDGFIEQQLFKEGADVKAGDMMFTLEK